MNTTIPGSHLSALPPSTRSVLGSSTSSSTKSTPSSPISTSSIPGGTSLLLSSGAADSGGRSERNKDEYISERTPTVRAGTRVINMNVSSSPSTSTDGAGATAIKQTEHLGSHEHLTYTATDDLDEFSSPGASSNNLGYRQHQQHAGTYGSLRATTGAQLRVNRAAATGASVYGVNQSDLFSPGGGVGALHALHSKGSNLSTNTFIAGPSRDRDKERLEREPLPTSSNTTPGTATPTPGNQASFTPTLQHSHPGQPSMSMPAMNPAVTRSKASTPSTPATNAAALPHAPQSTSYPSSSVPSGMSAPSHSAVTRTKSTTSSNPPISAPLPNNHRASGSRRGTIARDRDREGGDATTSSSSRRAKVRTTPHLPSGPPVELAAPALMYWSRAPVYGHLPTRSMRAHSVTLVDNTAWLFGGCDERGCARDVWCCDVETFQWSQPVLVGDIPPPCRAHTATLVDKRIFIFGGGEGPTYYNSLYILDTQTKRFIRVPCGQPSNSSGATAQPDTGLALSPTSSTPSLPAINSTAPFTPMAGTSIISTPATPAANGSFSSPGLVSGPAALSSSTGSSGAPPLPMPLPRRAHTSVLYKHKLYIFGGGNGVKALNDVWSLDTSVPVDKMRWEKVLTIGSRPGPRGYHTANLVGNIMIVVGGSDGRDCFADIWVLNLDTLVWTLVETDKEYKRLSHSSTQVGSYLFIMGGHDGLKYSSELLLFNLVTLQFEHKQTAGRPPPARGYHIALLGDARLLVFGGFDGHAVYDDVWILDLAGAAYLPQVTSFALLIESAH